MSGGSESEADEAGTGPLSYCRLVQRVRYSSQEALEQDWRNLENRGHEKASISDL